MQKNKYAHPLLKHTLHNRNKHCERYNFKDLIEQCAELKPFVIINKYGDESIDFFNSVAVKMLNKALLKKFYKINYWELPEKYLCPPIPGRADYIHHVADLILNKKSKEIKCLDIGVGANCIYPIIGIAEYNWNFVGSDIDKNTLDIAQEIIDNNIVLKNKIELRLQKNKSNVFNGIIKPNEFFDLTICNPPFHTSAKEAMASNLQKLRNLKKEEIKETALNFGGKSNELWCNGGEDKFVRNLILESTQFKKSCNWFTTLISKESNLKGVYQELKLAEATLVKTIKMELGNKKSRIVAWSFV